MNMLQKKRVVLCSASGFSNMGDEAILAGNLEALRNILRDQIEFVVLSYHPDRTSQLHGVPSIYDLFWLMDAATKGYPKKTLRALNLLIVVMKLVWNARRISRGLSPKFVDRSQKQFLTALAESSAILLVGGGNLNDIMLRGGLLARSLTAYLARLLGKPVFMGAQTIGPLNSRLSRFLAKRLVQMVEVITLREDYSRRLLDELDIKHPNIKVVFDDAFNVKFLNKQDAKELLTKEDIDVSKLHKSGFTLIGVTPRAWWEWNNDYLPLRTPLDKTISFLLTQEKYFVLFIPTSFHHGCSGDDDAETAMGIVERIGMSRATNYKVLRDQYNWYELKAILGLMDFVVGTSFHSLVFALSMGVPTMGLYTDEYYRLKIGGLLDLMGMTELAIDVNNVDAYELINKLQKALDGKALMSERIQQRIAEMSGSACSAAKQLAGELYLSGS